MELGSLYLIGTPLGNAQDITLRALTLFKELNTFFAEDTREFSKLLNVHEISLSGKKIHSFASHNMKPACEQALALLTSGQTIALVTDRGMPGISDPGAMLVAQAHEAGIRVIPIPGPSSVTTLYSVSGLGGTAFLFTGFFPEGEKVRGEWVAQVKLGGIPVCFFESPKRVQETAEFLKQQFPLGRLFLGREMTKQFEEYRWISLSGSDLAMEERGEFSLILDPGEKAVPEDALSQAIALRLLSEKDWAKALAKEFHLKTSDVYNALQKSKTS